MFSVKNILLSHGSGGKQSDELIRNLFLKYLNSYELSKLEDSAVMDFKGKKLAFTTDSYVVDPIFFPGGDIGRLCISGTVNDISVSGAKIMAISLGFIIEEGLEVSVLEKILISIKKTLREANVKVVTGDTKVVEKGKVDKIFINSSGVGYFDNDRVLSYKNVRKGDLIIINGEIASHGIAVLNERKSLGLKGDIKSDVAPLNGLIELVSDIKGIRCMKDATRGGIATAINEISQSCGYGVLIEEENIPVSPSVRSACQALGIDPLYVANEGKVIVVVDEKDAASVVDKMKRHKYGRKASIIGRFTSDKEVMLQTSIGSKRILPPLSGEQMPRIC